MKNMKLTEICNPKQWKTLSTEQLLSSGYSVYGANGKIGYYNDYNHENPTVMITCRGATCGAINLSEPKSWINGNAMCLDDLSEKVNLRYLVHYLSNYDFRNVISGSAQPQITRESLNKVTIKLYEPKKQEEIANNLDKIKKIIEQYKSLLLKYDTLIKSRFIEMFGDPVINTRNWQIKSIGDSCFVTKLAGFEYSKYIHYSDIGDVVMVKAQNVKNGKLNNKELSYISNEVSDSLPRSQLAKNDVVMTYVGANIGDVAVIDDKYKYHLAPNVAKIRPNVTIYNSHFLVQLLMLLRNYIVGNSADTAKAAIGMEKIRQLKLPIPPIDFQNDFASFVQQIDKSKFEIEKIVKMGYN